MPSFPVIIMSGGSYLYCMWEKFTVFIYNIRQLK